MWRESSEQAKPLRTGITTGACATACALAAAQYLLTGNATQTATITLPKGQTIELPVRVSAGQSAAGESYARAETIKDAGDDPDVTHGATVFVVLQLTAKPGVQFKAAAGVGTVTREGLALAVGEPAINPVPRQMMSEQLQALAAQKHFNGGFCVAVGVENGEQLASKTMNPKLGIVGGLSILGTTGIVRPFSCAAWIASIHQGIDVASANGITHIAASTGNASEALVRDHYQLPDSALIEMGDFVGAVLKHLRHKPLPRLTLCGGFGKLCKLANGHMDLHSRASSMCFAHIANVAAQHGASPSLQQQIKQANTSIEALKLCQQQGIALADAICEQALQVAQQKVQGSAQALQTDIEVLAINRQGQLVGYAGRHAYSAPRYR
jgi:cobalt-precorrin-5B (C1)-methyltransferase